ncbi:hypothetical protein HH1059_20040 [Halorhodospira halochloris]|uniref:Uncharacterized protein n=1 Tax=Halorhodospira halochloris TaxID=1052 RepID=A0A2Z6EZX1_HALHR|nr:hypothetical protein HH1059_20040 [Halorhodospira halochloris]
MAAAIDESLDQNRGLAVLSGPVLGQAAQDLTKHMARQSRHTQVPPDQKARVANHPIEVLGAGNIAPTDPAVAGAKPQSWRRKGERRYVAKVLAAHEIAQAPPDQRAGAKKVLGFE